MLQCIEQCPGLIKSFRRIQGCCSFIHSLNKCVPCAFLVWHVSDEALGDRSVLRGVHTVGKLKSKPYKQSDALRLGGFVIIIRTGQHPKGHSTISPSNVLLSLKNYCTTLSCSSKALYFPSHFHIIILTHILHGGWKSFQKMPIIFS